MTRPTWPADPSPDEAQPDSQQADSAPPRPTFTPRHQGPDSQGPYPAGPVSPPPPTAPLRTGVPPPDGGRVRPSFTPRSATSPTPHTVPPGRDDQRGGDQRGDDQRADAPGGPGHGDRRPGDRRHGDSRIRPTFTPREGYIPPPPDARRRAAYPPPTAFLPPPGFPQESSYSEATRVFDIPRAGAGPDVPGLAPDRDTSPNLSRSAKVMALGTLASRVTGLIRTFVFVAALGGKALADAYNNSNTLPNTVYYLMLGGIFTSVVVPMLVSAAKNDRDKGEAYAERVFTLGVISLLIVTVTATLLAGPLVDLYAGGAGAPGSPRAAEHHLMVIFAYFFIPQIFFYGMDSLLGAILNVRGRFGANMWTPVINNVIVILVGVLFIVIAGPGRTPQNLSGGEMLLLGIGTTAGILIQSICLFPVMRRAGFSMRLRGDLRRAEISEIGRQAGWLLGYVISQWAGNLVVQRVANAAGQASQGNGYSAYSYAWSLFQLPYAVVGISIISALLPRMSGHATDRRYSLVREDFSTGVRLASVIVVPAAVFLAVLGAPLCEFLFSYFSSTVSEARYYGEVFGVFSLGLVPFMLTQLQLRVFYSFHENRTPAIIGVIMLAVGIVGDLIALSVLPKQQVVIGLAAAYGLVTLTGAVVSWPLLLRRVGSLDGWRITRSLVRMFLATLPGLAFILATRAIVGSFLHAGPGFGFVTTVIGGGGALILYAICARLLKVEEFRVFMRSLAGRLGR
jgi:putative peptidoglycan lipid II flippase